MNASAPADVTRQPIFNSIEQACNRLGVRKTKFYEFVNAGSIGTVKLHGRRLVPEDELLKFAAAVRNGEFSEVA
ncbi:helix-turn-helix domain-containing protein [Beijerinckia mobilis]|uniref:helix-turn-helix domain-containing protein n=1 Tax=Beijerinckia mobilis TaxID=231434 RepID=UPI000554AC11|nr:helix-turn-helix domain-containing protein [Beijerinckia mobilis]